MADTDSTKQEPETVVQGNSKTEGTSPTNSQQTDSEAEQLRKQLEQARMREQQLLNEKAEREKQEEESRRKKLEEENEWKELAERERQRADELERTQTEAKRSSELSEAKTSVLAEYPPEVAQAAEKLGLSLSDTTDEAKEDFKTKLDVLKETTPAPKVTGNNISPNQTGTQTDEEDWQRNLRQMRFDDKQLRERAVVKGISSLPQLDEMRKQAGYTPRPK
jgi:hypothetical protein